MTITASAMNIKPAHQTEIVQIQAAMTNVQAVEAGSRACGAMSGTYNPENRYCNTLPIEVFMDNVVLKFIPGNKGADAPLWRAQLAKEGLPTKDISQYTNEDFLQLQLKEPKSGWLNSLNAVVNAALLADKPTQNLARQQLLRIAKPGETWIDVVQRINAADEYVKAHTPQTPQKRGEITPPDSQPNHGLAFSAPKSGQLAAVG